MTTGTWFVLCDPARAIGLADLAKRLGRLRKATIRQTGDVLVVEVHDRVTTEISVGFSQEPHVAIEAAEIAERQRRPEVAQIAGRYELLWGLRYSDEVYNTLAVIAGELEKACGGVIYDATNGRFV